MLYRVERDENACVLLRDSEEKLATTSLRDAIPKYLPEANVDHGQVNKRREECSIRKQLVSRQLWLALIQKLAKDALTGTEGHREHIEKGSCCEITVINYVFFILSVLDCGRTFSQYGLRAGYW